MATAMNGTLRRYILALRIKELTEVLDRLGLRKGGRKAELQTRVMSVFAPEGATSANQARVLLAKKYVEEAYCRMIGTPYTPSDGPSAAPGGAAGGAPGGVAPQHHAQQPYTAACAPQQPAYGAAAGGGGGSGGAAKRQRTSPVYGGGAGGAAGDLLPLSFDELIGASNGNTAIRCLCGGGAERASMVQCDAPQCHVWQHADCVGAANAGGGAAGKAHYCERCRVARADPFWEVYDANLFQPMRVAPTGRTVQIGNQVAPYCTTGERCFYISAAQMDSLRLRNGEFRLQVMAIQLDDANLFRFHWPLMSELIVNRQPVRVYTRSSTYKLGANQRDDAADVSRLVVQGRNTVSFSCSDARPFAVALILMRQRTLQQVKALMEPREALPAALERVKRCIRGGAAEDDDDIEFGNVVVSLKDPYTCCRVAIPARFTDAGSGLEPFDLEPFLDTARRTRKWTDPHTMRHSCVQRLQVDTYLEHVLAQLPPDVMEVEIDPRGRWRPAASKGPFRSVLPGEHDAPDAAVDDAGAAGVAEGGSRQGGDGGSGETRGSGSGAGGGGGAAATSIKPDPEHAAGGGGGGAGAGAGTESEEEDEMAELRAAAAQAAEAVRRKRGKEADVIELLDSDDDDAPQAARPAPVVRPAPIVRLPAVQQQHQQQQQQRPPAAGAQVMQQFAAHNPRAPPHLAPYGQQQYPPQQQQQQQQHLGPAAQRAPPLAMAGSGSFSGQAGGSFSAQAGGSFSAQPGGRPPGAGALPSYTSPGYHPSSLCASQMGGGYGAAQPQAGPYAALYGGGAPGGAAGGGLAGGLGGGAYSGLPQDYLGSLQRAAVGTMAQAGALASAAVAGLAPQGSGGAGGAGAPGAARMGSGTLAGMGSGGLAPLGRMGSGLYAQQPPHQHQQQQPQQQQHQQAGYYMQQQHQQAPPPPAPQQQQRQLPGLGAGAFDDVIDLSALDSD